MKPIIFVRISSMYYYKGVTTTDTPQNGGSYVSENNYAHECYNFDAINFDDGTTGCIGFAQILARDTTANPQIKLENIVGCSGCQKEEAIDGVTVVWCAKANSSKHMRVVGFYKNATVYRHYQETEFDNGYIQVFNFAADKENCVLLPYQERFINSNWYVPTSGHNSSDFGFGRSSIWFGGSSTNNKKEIEYVERMINNIENYNGENWIDKRGAQ